MNISDAYNTGYEAFLLEDGYDTNPYERHTWDHEQWNQGWNDAESDDYEDDGEDEEM